MTRSWRHKKASKGRTPRRPLLEGVKRVVDRKVCC